MFLPDLKAFFIVDLLQNSFEEKYLAGALGLSVEASEGRGGCKKDLWLLLRVRQGQSVSLGCSIFVFLLIAFYS